MTNKKSLTLVSTAELFDRSNAGYEATEERMRRIEKSVLDLLRRVCDMEGVLAEQFRDETSEVESSISSVTVSTARYCDPPPRTSTQQSQQ